MKQLALAFSLVVLLSGCEALKNLPINTGVGGVTEAEAGQGIKEALSQGVVNAIFQLNKEDGFFGDALYKILLPPDAKKIENTLK